MFSHFAEGMMLMPSLGIPIWSWQSENLRFGVGCCSWNVHPASTQGGAGWLISHLIFYRSEVTWFPGAALGRFFTCSWNKTWAKGSCFQGLINPCPGLWIAPGQCGVCYLIKSHSLRRRTHFYPLWSEHCYVLAQFQHTPTNLLLSTSVSSCLFKLLFSKCTKENSF